MYAVKKVEETAVSRILYFPCGKRQPSVCATSTRDSNAASNGSPPIWSCSGRGLQRRGDHSPSRWALTPPFHPYPVCTGRFAFCCTLLPEGFPCSVESGLSSGPERPAAARCLLKGGNILLHSGKFHCCHANICKREIRLVAEKVFYPLTPSIFEASTAASLPPPSIRLISRTLPGRSS